MPRRRAQKNHFWLDPAGIALLYLGASLLWIFFSDSLLLRAGLDPETLTRWQSTKGTAFVTVSALVLYVLMRAGQQLLRTQAQQLEASEAQYRLLFENNPRPMWIYDLETLRFLAVNQAAVALYGYREEEFLGMTILDIRPEEDRPRVAASAWAPRGPLKHSGPWRHLTKDGRMLEVEIDSHMLTWKGRRAVLVLVQDVTERNRIARENARYRQGLEILLELSRRLQQELMDCDRLAQQLVQTVRQVIPSADAALLWLRRGGRFVLVAKADGPEALPLGYTLPASGELLERLQAEEALAPAEVARISGGCSGAARSSGSPCGAHSFGRSPRGHHLCRQLHAGRRVCPLRADAASIAGSSGSSSVAKRASGKPAAGSIAATFVGARRGTPSHCPRAAR
ncbi:PAS domain S-box protein [Rhodothermus bifroesti]|nr:PAS domain S-box protein [Rhodothermus bifroesti]